MKLNNSKELHPNGGNVKLTFAKLLVYFYIFLSVIDALLFLDFSSNYVYLTIGTAIIYIGLSIVIGWLILDVISKKSKNSYVLPLIVLIISAFSVVYDFENSDADTDHIIPILELITLAILFFTMRKCYREFSWENEV